MATDLPPRQQRFVDEYLIDLNATQAAIRAGYSARRASEIGYQLLQKTPVAEAVAHAEAERSARIGLTQDRVLEEMAALAFAKLGDFARWDSDTFELIDSAEIDSRAVVSVTQKTTTMTSDNGDLVIKRERGIKLHDKVAALVKVGQHIGLFAEKHEHSGPGGEAFQVEVKAKDYREGLTPFLPPEGESGNG
jgi:phage terminase small subunit